MTYVIGLTGGIGSGKTAASDHFATLGITIVDADLAARAVVEKGTPALDKIANHFGRDILLPDGTLDRAKLRKAVFSDPEKRKWLESLTHPLIRDEIANGLNNATSPYTILVSPLLVESGQNRMANRVLVVDAPESAQLSRTIERDRNSETQVKAIMAAQTSREERLSSADDVIANDGSLQDLQKKVEAMHEKYLQLAQQHSNSSL